MATIPFYPEKLEALAKESLACAMILNEQDRTNYIKRKVEESQKWWRMTRDAAYFADKVGHFENYYQRRINDLLDIATKAIKHNAVSVIIDDWELDRLYHPINELEKLNSKDD